MALIDEGRAHGRMATSPRRSREQIEAVVLDILARAPRPMSAYDIADRADEYGQQVLASQVHRTLRYLVRENRVLRVESLSAYIIKDNDGDACLVCDQCGETQIVSTGPLSAALEGLATPHGFDVDRIILEMHGYCRACVPGMTAAD